MNDFMFSDDGFGLRLELHSVYLVWSLVFGVFSAHLESTNYQWQRMIIIQELSYKSHTTNVVK